jgi:hypothetical protein
MDMAISNMPKKVKSQENFAVIRYSPAILFQGGYKEKHIKINGILKRGDDLILGNGEIQITLGASHFVNDAAIDFDRKFTAVECVDENK